MSHNVEVATTIAQQIGNGCLFYMGARQMVAVENGLQFKVGRNPEHVKAIRIELTPADDYTVKFYRDLTGEPEVLKEIYCDQLNPLIADHIGL